MVIVTALAVAAGVVAKVVAGKAVVPVGVKLAVLLCKGSYAIGHGISSFATASAHAQLVYGATAGSVVLAGSVAASQDVVDLLHVLIQSSRNCASANKMFGKELHNITIQLEQINGSRHIQELQKMKKFPELMDKGLKLVKKCNKVRNSKLKYLKKVDYSDELKSYNIKLKKFLEKVKA